MLRFLTSPIQLNDYDIICLISEWEWSLKLGRRKSELPVRMGLLQGKAPAFGHADPSLGNKSQLGLGPSTSSPPVIRDGLTNVH